MATRMQQRRDTAANWLSSDPVLASGEIGVDTDSGEFRLGDGSSTWSQLSPFKNLADLGGNLDDYIPLTQRGTAEGVATLDVDGQVPASQLANATVDLTGYATETYVGTTISNLIDSAPGALDTLNELAAALGDDANYAATVTTALGNKQDIVSGVSSTEIGYLDGVTSAIQTQIDAKIPGNQPTITNPTIVAGYPSENSLTANVGVSSLSVTQVESLGSYQYRISILDNQIPEGYDPFNPPQNFVSPVFKSGLYYDILNPGPEAGDRFVFSNTGTILDGVALPIQNFDSSVYPVIKITVQVSPYNPFHESALVSLSQTGVTYQSGSLSTRTAQEIFNQIDEKATTTYVNSAISNLVDSAPGALDTLNELAAALNDDQNFASTVTNQIAQKANSNSPTFTGLVNFSNSTVVGIDSLPTQTGNAGKYLSTNGTTASWQEAATQTPHPFAMIG